MVGTNVKMITVMQRRIPDVTGRVEQALVPTKLRTVKQRVQSVGIVDIILYH